MSKKLRFVSNQVEFLEASANRSNRAPFKGVLTYFNAASDQPVSGVNRRVFIPLEVGVKALDTLIGTPLNIGDRMDRHQKDNVIGVIEKAYVGEALANGAVPVYVEGVLFAKNRPDDFMSIKKNKQSLGFSYEADGNGIINEENVFVPNEILFSGATVLWKKSAAYQSTSIAANSTNGGVTVNLNARLAQLQALVSMFANASNDAEVESIMREVKTLLQVQANADLTTQNEALKNELTTLTASVSELTKRVGAVEESVKTNLAASSGVSKDDFDKLKNVVDGLASYGRKSGPGASGGGNHDLNAGNPLYCEDMTHYKAKLHQIEASSNDAAQRITAKRDLFRANSHLFTPSSK